MSDQLGRVCTLLIHPVCEEVRQPSRLALVRVRVSNLRLCSAQAHVQEDGEGLRLRYTGITLYQ